MINYKCQSTYWPPDIWREMVAPPPRARVFGFAMIDVHFGM